MEIEYGNKDTNLDYALSKNRKVDSLQSGVKRVWIEIGFAIMLISAICTYSTIDSFLSSSLAGTVCKVTINTLGMVIIYYAMLKGMRPLYHPLTIMWIVLLVLNVVGFVTSLLYFFGEPFESIDFLVAASLSLAYLPMGVLLMTWYRGKLGRVGLWMILRILTCILLPIAWFMLLGERLFIVCDIIIVVIEVIYAVALRNVLVAKSASESPAP